MTRADKKAYIEDLASQVEEAAHRGEQGQVYKITKLVSGRYRRATEIQFVDRQGRLLTTEAEKEARWVEHFSEVLNKPPTTTEVEVQYPDTDLDVSTAPPEKEEIIAAIRSLKNGKSPGQDSLNAELFKAELEFAAQVLQPLFATIWEEKQLLNGWTEGVIVKIPKKGALSNCNNWREITLLSAPSKILAKLIIKRISEAVDQQLRQEQAGFRKGRGCIDQIFTLRNIIEQCTEWQRQWYINYVDFEKASIASTENVYGAYSGHMEFHSRLSLSLRASITNSSVEWGTANPASM